MASTPGYSSVTGKLWLEHGGVYVLANIRGGGEFGPAGHEAGVKTKRQRIYDDFYVVAEDLLTRKITSSRRLGVLGESNGGLLVGLEFTQHPEMWGPVVIQVRCWTCWELSICRQGRHGLANGSVSVAEERAILASISPYNQLKPNVDCPEPLIFTTTKDDRVGPVHARSSRRVWRSFTNRFSMRRRGHGEGADKEQEARTDAEYFTYLMMKVMDSSYSGPPN